MALIGARAIPRRGVAQALCAALLAAGLGCAEQPPPERIEPVGQADLEHARAALVPFKQQLVKELTAGLAAGTDQAIEVCKVKAPRIASSLSVGGVAMGRTSHKLRNPHNAAAPWLEPLLEDYVSAKGAAQPRAVRLEDDRFGYVEPIYVKSACLICHGGEIDEKVALELEKLYPQDRATGFEVGDFRGLFWVTMPLSDS
ncbi:MAG: DUF3365 domain-containing protein [Acidobacteriota bacterium]|nr:MAG: DUF3365 domain-containing protein [Acidobacteriota bacterium]